VRDAVARVPPVAWRLAGLAAVLLVAFEVPLQLDRPNLQICVLVAAAMVGAMGLNILVGFTGQLSLAHPFFLAVGAMTYSFLSGQPSGSGDSYAGGTGWPPLLAAIAAATMSGALGIAFSPIAGRLKGIYLGIASLGLVFVGQHLLFNWRTVTGGFNGRIVPVFSLFGIQIDDSHPSAHFLGVPFGHLEKLWYLDAAVVILAYLFARNAMRGRPGRALLAIRESEVAAQAMGINVTRQRAYAFGLSSVYAGIAGVLLALANGAIVPETFGFTVAVDYLAMVVIGGLGSLIGSCIGAAFVIAFPLVLQNNAGSLPFVAAPGASGFQAAEWATLIYGALIVLVLLFEDQGLAGLTRRIGRALLGSVSASGGRPPDAQEVSPVRAAPPHVTDQEAGGVST
jgi:branched-chain amino acid transport system permease protein